MTARTYVGYHPNTELPFKRGETIVIPKGVIARRVGKMPVSTREERSAKVIQIGRGLDVSVYDALRYHRDRLSADLIAELKALEGTREYHYRQVPIENPSVTYAMKDGSYRIVDMNDLLERNGKA